MSEKTGVRAELVVSSPPDCPVAGAADGGAGRLVARTRGETTVTEEAVVEDADALPDDAEAVYEEGSSTVYRFERRSRNCVCEVIEDHGCPVVDARVRDGDLHVVFHATDRESLKEVVEDLRGAYPSVGVRRVTSAGGSDELVHTDGLTDRQREALETAHRMGYFDHPKGANATDVADEMGIAASTFTEHLAAAQTKLLDEILG